jgi:hypothetical protein
MDEFSSRVDRGSDLVSDLRELGRKMFYRKEKYTGRTIGAFAAGLGLGIGVGLLLAPASGKQTRDSISGKIQDIGSQVGERFETEKRNRPTGSEGI